MTHFSKVTDLSYYQKNFISIHWVDSGSYKVTEPYIIQTDDNEVHLNIREVHPSPDAPLKKGWTLLVLENPKLDNTIGSIPPPPTHSN